MYLKGLPYCDAEVSQNLRSCLHYERINSSPRTGENGQNELRRQWTPIRVKYVNMKDLEKCKFVLSIITITPIMKTDRQKMVNIGILQVIDDVVFVCICRVY